MITHSCRPLRYEGSVQFDAPQSIVWQYLTDPAVSAHITPAVVAWQTIVPGELFQVEVGVQMGERAVTLPVEIAWSNMVAPEAMSLRATTVWERCQFEIIGDFALSENAQGGVLAFTAVAHLSNPAVRPFAHAIAQRTLRQFFVNLKEAIANRQPVAAAL